MKRWQWILLAYLAAVAGFGGWYADRLWDGWGIWVLGLAPLLMVVYVLIVELRRQPTTRVAFGIATPPLVACVFLSACSLAIAWLAAEMTRRWSEPALRAGVAAGAIALTCLIAFATRPRRASGPDDTTGSA